MLCRCCNNKLRTFLIDLGKSPLANTLAKRSNEKIKKFDLQVYICNKCWLCRLMILYLKNKYLKMIILTLVVILKLGLIISINSLKRLRKLSR